MSSGWYSRLWLTASLTCLTLLGTIACSSPSSPALPQSASAPPATPTSTPTPTATPTPVVRQWTIANDRNHVEIGCGFFCAHQLFLLDVTRTNNPLVANRPLDSNDEFLIVTLEYKSGNDQGVVLSNFWLSGQRTVGPINPAIVHVAQPFPSTLKHGEVTRGQLIFQIAKTETFDTLAYRFDKEIRSFPLSDTPTIVPTSRPTTIPTPTAEPTATPVPTSTLIPTSTPVPTATPSEADLEEAVDTAWNRGDWPQVEASLESLRRVAPDALNFDDKLYAAHLNAGNDLLAAGEREAAASEFAKAAGIDPSRDEATASLRALTPTPTRAPATATPVPHLPADVTTYLRYMQPKLATIGQSMVALSEQSSQASRSPLVVFSTDWRLKTATALALLKVEGDEIQKYEPVPAELKPLDNLMVQLGKDLNYAADEYAAGVDKVDGNRIRNAAARIETATSRVSQIKAELLKLSTRYNVPIDLDF
jgi:hypothetical protein